jgi:hypothetical protein
MIHLPNDVFEHCMSFIGPGHYRYIAGVNHRFRDIYRIKHVNKTTWESAAASTSRAELCFEDERKRGWDGRANVAIHEHSPIREIALNAAKWGQVNVIQWAASKGFDFDARAIVDGSFLHTPALCLAAQNGHVNVLEWTVTNNLGMSFFSLDLAYRAAGGGQVAVLAWLRDRGMLTTEVFVVQDLSREAANNGHLQVLDWLLDHGFDHETIKYIAAYNAAGQGSITLLEWAKDRGYVFVSDDDRNRELCLNAVRHNNLPTLQWLRGNHCPWDFHVVRNARAMGHEDVEAWAIENGCPVA